MNYKLSKYNSDNTTLPPVAFKELFVLKKGKSPVKTEKENGVSLPYLSVDVLRGKQRDVRLVNSGVLVKSGDILIICDGANSGDVLRGQDGYCSSTVALLSTNGNKEYLYYVVLHAAALFKNDTKGTQVQHLDTGLFKNHKVTQHTAVEQSAIAAVLSKQESVVHKLTELVERLGERNMYMLGELLSGRTRLSKIHNALKIGQNTKWKSAKLNNKITDVPDDWKIEKFVAHLKLANGSAFKPNEWGDSGKPIVRIANLNGSTEFNYYEGNKNGLIDINKGDVLFAWSATIDVFKWGLDNCVLNQHTFKVEGDDTYGLGFPYYVVKSVLKHINENLAHGSTMKHVTKKSLETIDIARPCKEEQQLIAELLDKLENEKQKYEELLSKEKQRFDYLLEELMSGRLRVVETTTENEALPEAA